MPRSGWHDSTQNESLRQYDHELGDVFSVNFFDLPPDIGASLTDERAIQDFYRALLQPNGAGMIHCTVRSFCDMPCVDLLTKYLLDPHGLFVMHSLTIPKRDFSFVLKYQAIEGPLTGLRESAVFASEQISIDEETGLPIGWVADPYDPSLEYDVMRNLADDPKYDAQFPEHPLSRARDFVANLESITDVAEIVRDAQPFSE